MTWSCAIWRIQRWNGITGLRRYSASRWLALSKTSWTTSLASTRPATAWSSRNPIIRRSAGRYRSQSSSAAEASRDARFNRSWVSLASGHMAHSR